MSTRTCLLSGLAAFTLAGCANGPANTTVGFRRDVTRHVTRDAAASGATLTATELARVPAATNAYEAVRYLRPMFLRPRPNGNTLRGHAPVIAVYINDTYAGGVDVLQSLPTRVVARMRYLQRSEALMYAGSATPGDGFIMVTLTNSR
jgi:hypothetical protein